MATLYDMIRAARAAQSTNPYGPLNPEEEQSALASLGGATWNGVQWVAGSLGKLGRTVRNAIGLATGVDDASARELLAFLPFSDTLGITDPKDEVFGRDLLDSWGVTARNKPGIAGLRDFMGDLAGFGVDVFTDPLSYINGPMSALTSGGKAAKAAGILDDALLAARRLGPAARTLGKFGARARTTAGDILANTADLALRSKRTAALGEAAKKLGLNYDDIVNMPLSGAFEFAPLSMFTPQSMRTVYGTGKWAQRTGDLLDLPGRMIGNSPLGRYARSAAAQLDATRRGVTDKDLIPYPQQATRQTEELQLAAGRTTQQILSMMKDEPIDAKRLWGLLDGAITPATDVETRVVQAVRKANKLALKRQKLAGVKQYEHFSHAGTEFTHRVIGEVQQDADAFARPGGVGTYVEQTTSPSARGRAEWTNGWTGETTDLNNLVAGIQEAMAAHKGPTMRGRAVAEVARTFRSNWRGWDALNLKPVPRAWAGELRRMISKEKLSGAPNMSLIQDLERQVPVAKMLWRRAFSEANGLLVGHPKFKGLTPAEVVQKLRGDEGFAGAIERAKNFAERLKPGTPMFPDNPLTNLDQYLREGAENVAAATNVSEAYADMVRNIIPGVMKGKSAKSIPIMEALKKTRLNPQVAIKEIQRIARRTSPDPAENARLLKELKKTYLDKAKVAELASMYRGFQAPANIQPLNRLAQSATNLFKMGVLTSPARHVRDALSSIWSGMFLAGTRPRSFWETKRLLQGKPSEWLLGIPAIKEELAVRSLPATKENAALIAAEWADASQAIGRHQGAVTGQASGALSFTPNVVPTEQLLTQRIGQAGERSIMDLIGPEKQMFTQPGAFKPWRTRGVQTSLRGSDVLKESEFSLAKWSEKVGNSVESWVRMSTLLDRLRKGDSLLTAKRIANETYVNYNPRTFTPFENDVMMTAVPFYRYSRRILPMLLRRLSESPGGPAAVTVKAAAGNQGEEVFTPDYVSGGLALPLGYPDKEGHQRFLTSLGLPFEQFNLLETGDRGATKTGLNLLGMLNPFIKGPLEQATGRQFYSDSDLRDVEGRIGTTLENWGVIDDASQIPQPLEQVLSNSPLSRVASNIGTLSDPRKSWFDAGVNLLTGLRITDVDLQRQKQIEIRNRLRDRLRGEPGVGFFETPYVREDAAVSPETATLIRLMATIRRDARQRARAAAAAE